MPTVSIITPCFNAERFIGQTIESVIIQCFTDWEMVVVDDGSTDASAEIVATHARHDARIRLVQQTNGGMCRARNAGFAASSTDSRYLLFLDADDIILPQMLGRSVRELETHQAAGMVSCATECIDASGTLIPGPNFAACVRPVPWGPWPWLRILPPTIAETPFVSVYTHWTGMLASNTLIRRSVYCATPGWDEAFGDPAEDRYLFSHIALLSEARYLDEALLRYRRYPGQMSSNGARIATQERRLYEMWRPLPSATPQQWRAWVQADRFREQRFLPYLLIRMGNEQLRAGSVAAAVKSYVRAAWQAGRAAALWSSSALPPRYPARGNAHRSA